jgi:hypothetical protein
MALNARKLLFAFLLSGLALIMIDHLGSPPLSAIAGVDENACAPCGAPCPSTR